MLLLWLLVIALALGLAVAGWRLQQVRAGDAQVRRRIAAVLDNLSVGLSVWDTDQRLVACNERFREFYPAVELKPGLQFEDLLRFTVTRGLLQIPEEDIDFWVADRVECFSNVGRDVLRTADGRWLEIRRIPTDRLEVVILYADITTAREAELELAKGGQLLIRQLAGQTLLQETIEVAATAKSFESGVQRVIDLVCEWSGWPVACAYRVSPDDPDHLVPMGLWHLSDPEPFASLRASTEQASERKGEGVSGRALKTADLVWIANVAVDPGVPAERRAEMPGIRGACAVPITSAGRVVAVLEFLAREQLVPDLASTRLLRAVGSALGQVFTHRGI